MNIVLLNGISQIVALFVGKTNKITNKTRKKLILIVSAIVVLSLVGFCSADNPDSATVNSINITHLRGEDQFRYTMTGEMYSNADGWIDIEQYYFQPNILTFNGYASTISGVTTLSASHYLYSSFISSNSPSVSNGEIVSYTVSFFSSKLTHNATGRTFGVYMYIASTNVTITFDYYFSDTSDPFYGDIYYSLQPIISIDSEFYNNYNTRIEYTTDDINWYESTYDSLTIDDYQYKLRIFDIHSDELIYQDLSFSNFTSYEDIEIVTIRLINNANEPVYFHISNATSTYNNASYLNTPELCEMFEGTKNTTALECLDYDDMDSLLLEPVYSVTGDYLEHTEEWDPQYFGTTWNNTLLIGDLEDMREIDANYIENQDEVMSTAGSYPEDFIPYDYEWSFENWYATSSLYVYGTFVGSYSNMNTDDTDYYAITSSESSTLNDYEWSMDQFDPTNVTLGAFGSSSSPYSYMNEDDTNYYVIETDPTLGTQVDYVWDNGMWYPTANAFSNGSATGSWTDFETQGDSNIYIVSCNSEGTQFDYIWDSTSWYPTDSSYTNGTGVNPYSYMSADDTDYYLVRSNSEGTEVDYVWDSGVWFPTNADFVNGTVTGAYSDLETQGDSNIYIVSCNSESVQVDYIWDDGRWNPTSSAYVNGTVTGAYSDMNTDDTDYYIIDSQWQRTITDYDETLELWYPYVASLTNGTDSGSFPTDVNADDSNYYNFICNSEPSITGYTSYNYTSDISFTNQSQIDGRYQGVYTFWNNTQNGETTVVSDWTETETYGTVSIIESYDGHYDVMHLYDTSGSGSVQARHTCTDSGTSGVVEMLALSDITYAGLYIYIFNTGTLAAGVGIESNNFRTYDSSGYEYHAAIGTPSADTWYKFTIVFESDQSVSFYINDTLYESGDDLANSVTSINTIALYTGSSRSNTHGYVDSVDMSWETNTHHDYDPVSVEQLEDEQLYMTSGSWYNGHGVSVLNSNDNLNVTLQSESVIETPSWSSEDYSETVDDVVWGDGTDTGAMTNFDSDDGSYVTLEPEATAVWSTATWDSYDSGSGAGTYTAWTNTYTAWDEAWYSDADYIYATVSAGASASESIAMGDSAITSTYLLKSVEVQVRYKISNALDVGVSVYIYIDGSWDYVGSCGFSTAWATATLTKNYAGAEDITDYNNMQVRVDAFGDPFGSGGTGYVSCVRTRAKYSYITGYNYDMDGYAEFDYTDIGSGMEDRDNITAIDLNYRFYSDSADIEIQCQAYNWDTTSWTTISTSSPTVETAYQSTSLTYVYFQDDLDDLLFRFRFYTTATETSDFNTYFDLLTLDVEYDELSSGVTQDISGYVEFDYSYLGSIGNITDRSDVTTIGVEYTLCSNISQTIGVYAYNWDTTSWTLLTSTIQVVETAYANYSLTYSYLKDDVDDLLFRLAINSTGASPHEIYIDLITLELEYDEQHSPVISYFHYIDGYFEWDLGALIDDGNMTDEFDLLDTSFSFIYLENSTYTDQFSIYVYDWTATAWVLINSTMPLETTQTTYTNNTLFDDNAYWSDDLKARFRIVYEVIDSSDSGTTFYTDFLQMSFNYTNKLEVYYDWYHYIDGYVDTDLSALIGAGEITSRDDFQLLDIDWIWETNESDTVTWYVYDWDADDWDQILSETQTSFATDTYTLGTEHINPSTYIVRIRFVSNYVDENTKDNSGIQISIDELDIYGWYEDHNQPTYNFYHYIDGYVEFDFSQLEIDGKIVSISDFTGSYFEWNWQTNISNSVDFYAYNFDTDTWDFMGSDTQTSFATDTNATTFDNTDYFDSITFVAQFRFVTEYIDTNTTTDTGIDIQFDAVNITVSYEDHTQSTYDWYHYIDGYVQFDLSDLVSSGEIVSLSDFMGSYFEWNWQTNVSNSVDFYVYDFTDSEWDFMGTDTQTSFATDTNVTIFDDTRYFDPSTFIAQFRFITEYTDLNTTINSGIELQFDLVNLTVSYEDHNQPTYDFYHYIDGYVQFDLSDLVSSGEIVSLSDFMGSYFEWNWQTNVSNSVDFYVYDFTDSEWDFMGTDTQTSFATDTNATTFDDTRYFDPSTFIAQFRFITEYTDLNTTTDSGINIQFDMVNLTVNYEDHNQPTYTYFHDLGGIIRFNILDLVTNGNITDYSDIVKIDYGILWKTNITVDDYQASSYIHHLYKTVDWDGTPDYYIDWVSTSGYSTDFVWNTTSGITYDTHTSLTYQYEGIDYTNQFTFNLNAYEYNTTTPHGVSLSIDEVYLNVTYENHQSPVYNWTYNIDGYVEWDLSSLISLGNITDHSDFELAVMTWIWETNISVDTAWYIYDFDGSSWDFVGNSTETSFITNTSGSNINYIDDTTYIARLRFVTNNTVFNSTTSTGNILLNIDYATLRVAYENQYLPLYRVSHTQYLLWRWDISELWDEYNVTARTDITQLNFTFRWYTNYSTDIEWSVWNNDVPYGYDIKHTETQTSWDTDNITIPITIANGNYKYVPTDGSYIYLQSLATYTEHNISYSQINRTHLYVDYMKLEVTYENQWDPYVDWNISAQITWDYTTALSGDFSWDWIYDTDIEYEYWFDTNSTIDIFNISCYYNITETTFFHGIAYETSTLVSNLSQSLYYANNSAVSGITFIMDINASITHELVQTNQIAGYLTWYNEFELNFEVINCTVNFLNQSDPIYTYSGIRDPIYVVPYDYVNSIIEDTVIPSGSGTLADPYIYQGYNITDQYGNYLQNFTAFADFTGYTTVNYTPPQLRTCLVSYADQRGEYLDFLEYKTRVNGTLIYSPYFNRELNDTVIISTYDRFDNFIGNTSYTVKREDNWIPINITLYSLKIYNQQESFMYFNLTEDPATDYYWSEYLAPNEITDFRLIGGNYTLNVTTYEDNETINSVYDYELTEDNFLLVDSKYNLLLLSEVYHENIFSNLTEWSNVYDDLSQIMLYEFTNAFTDKSIRIEFRYDGNKDAIVVSAGETIAQILPLNTTNYVEYRVFDLDTDELIDGYGWQNLPLTTREVIIGEPITVEPLTPTNIRSNSFFIWGFLGIIIVVVVIFMAVSYSIRKKLDPKQSTKTPKYIKKTQTIQPKGRKHRSGIMNFKDVSS